MIDVHEGVWDKAVVPANVVSCDETAPICNVSEVTNSAVHIRGTSVSHFGDETTSLATEYYSNSAFR